MEELAEVAQKDYEKLLLELRQEHGDGNPIYIPRSKLQQSKKLEAAGFVKENQ